MFNFGWILIKLFFLCFKLSWRSSWMMPWYLHIYKILCRVYNFHFSQEMLSWTFLQVVGLSNHIGKLIYGALRARMGIPAAAAAASESLLIEQSDLRKLQNNGGSCREIGRPDHEENYAAAEVSSISQIISSYGLKTTAPDEFGTIVVDTSSLPSDPATFSNLLEISLKQWRKQVKLSKLITCGRS